MQLENQVCSPEKAKRLNELGVKQESLFWWTNTWVDDECGKSYGDLRCSPQIVQEAKGISFSQGNTVAAFTVAELGEMLPKLCYSQQVHSDTESNRWETDAPEGMIEDTDERFLADTEADARAKMLIYLIENDLLASKEPTFYSRGD
jgi:hypothetical protein